MKRLLLALTGVALGVAALVVVLHRVTQYPPSVKVERYG